MANTDVAACYVEAWKTAADQFSLAFGRLQKAAVDIPDGKVDGVLRAAYWASWKYLREICRESRAPLRKHCDINGLARDSVSAGSATGFFFEHLVAALILPRIKRDVVDVEIEFNTCSHSDDGQLPRAPDIYLKVPTGREVVLELKQSVRLPTYNRLQVIRKKYEHRRICYLVVGGHVSLGKDALQQLREQKWAAFVDANGKEKDKDGRKLTLHGLPTVDDHIRTAVQHLRGLP